MTLRGFRRASHRVEPAVYDSSQVFESPSVKWLEVGCATGGLVVTADEFGFTAFGLDLRDEAARALQGLGYHALRGELHSLARTNTFEVISMADVFEHTPYPVGVLQYAHTMLAGAGVLFISCPNRECSSWRQMDAQKRNPY